MLCNLYLFKTFVLKVQQELLKHNHIKVNSTRASEETSESSEHFIPEETGQDSGIDGSVKDIAEFVKTNDQKPASGLGDACEAEVYFETEVIYLSINLKY